MILLAGGTGTLGRLLTPMLAASGLRVRTLTRHTVPDGAAVPGDDAEYVLGDVRDASTLDRAMDGVTVVVSAMSGFGGRDPLGSRTVDRDGNLRLIDAANRFGLSQAVLLSVHQAGPSHPMEIMRDKWAAEESLRASGLAWTIIRPTAYLETWLGLVGRPLVSTGTTRIFGTGRNPVNFVSAVDVAKFVRLAIMDPHLRGATIEVPGPENLTLDQLAAIVESTIGRVGRKRHIPPTGMRLARLLTRPFARVVSAQIAAALVMDSEDMAVDGLPLRAAYPSIPMTTATEVAARMFGSPTADLEP